ncbi:MAG: hypothetical protein GC191_03295 [Azospirillum sp.]|nr:hypothetical protein [Azospirillum sp.]
MTELATAYAGPAGAQDQLSVRGFVTAALGGWRLVLTSMVVAGMAAIGGLRLCPPGFTATMVVGPTARSGVAAMGARVPSTARGTPASVVEFGSGDEVLSDFSRFLELLTSVSVATTLIAPDDPLQPLPRLFPSRWNAATGRWQPPAGVAGLLRRIVLALVGRDDWLEPDAGAVARLLRRQIVVQTVGGGPMRRLSFRHDDRGFALALLGRIVAAADAHLRAEALRRAAAEIGHVKARLATVTLAEHRHALADLLAALEQVTIMIEVDLPFAADPIDPPNAQAVADWPSPGTVLPLALIAGAILGLFLVYARAAWLGRPRRGTAGGEAGCA